MSGISASTRTLVRRRVRPINEFSLWTTICVATLTIVTAALLSRPASSGTIAVPVVVLGAGGMFITGLADVAHTREVAFARALLVAGVLWSLSALTASASPWAFSIGAISERCALLAISYVLLSYPTGRLTDTSSRAVFAAGALVLGLLFLPTVLFASLPRLSLWTSCVGAGCPRNAFSVVASAPAFIGDVVVPVRQLLTVVLFAAIAVTVTRRARRVESPLGRLHAPIVAFAVVQAVVWMLLVPLTAIAPDSGALVLLGWIFLLSFPSLALTSGTGRLYERIHAANVLERLTRTLSHSATAADVRHALAAALGDPSLRILHSIPGDTRTWVDESGSAVQSPPAAADQRVTQVSSGNWRIAVVHATSLDEDAALVSSACSYALAALENQSLTDELELALHNLAQSRARRLASEQDTRQKIERDLHDGAQQHLMALRLKLGLAAAQLEIRDPEGATVLHSLEADVDATIEEVRALARGIYPPLLARAGLRDALREIARNAIVPTTVRVATGTTRYPADVETTVYFSCSEALQNAAKHADAVSAVTISVWQDHELHFEVRDDGAGFDSQSTPCGVGLNNLRDRLAVIGGTLTVHSVPGQGTVVTGAIPLAD